MSIVLSRKIEVSPRRWLLLPIETKARELEGKALLAFEAAERGWGSIVGRKSLRRNVDLPPGMLIEKSIPPGRAADIMQARAAGRRVSAWCEEGLVYNNADEYGQRKVERAAYELLDLYFAWGLNQTADMVDKLGCDARKIIVAGNPRFDLHRPEFRSVFSSKAAAIKKAYGPFILITTNFAFYNNYIGPDATMARMRARGHAHSAEPGKETWSRVPFQEANFGKFIPMVRALSQQHRDHRIVIRPHPSESHDPWRRLAAELPNASVVYEGNVAEWLLAAELLIHNNCTTGVEAYLLGRKAIAYSAFRDSAYDLFLPNALSNEVFELDQVIDAASKTLSGEAINDNAAEAKRADIAAYYIANISDKTACRVILDALDTADLPEVSLSFSTGRLGEFQHAVRRRLRPWKQLGITSEAAAWQRYANQKFEVVRRLELLALLRRTQQVTGRFDHVKIAELGENMFCIYQEA